MDRHHTPSQAPRLCRNCSQIRPSGSVCPHCSSDHYIAHKEIKELSIAHIDCDAFFASIEKRDNPDLQGKPVIVGGGKRGVVATCCYMARLFGVRSAMPMFKALKLCPNAVVVRPDFDKYKTASRAIRSAMDALTPLVQQVSIDEAYLDLSGTEKLHGKAPAELLGELQNNIQRDVGITVSIGLSYNKFLAKSASDLDKPNGFAMIGEAEAREFLAPRPVDFIHGVGPALARQISQKGYETLGGLQMAELKQLIGLFGETGLWLHERANGIDKRPVDPRSERKSVSAETTFFEDCSDKELLIDHLWWLCEKVALRSKEIGVAGNVLTLKLKTSDFKTRTRRMTLTRPTQLAQVMFRQGQTLLGKEVDGARFRLIGIGISDLEPAGADMADLIDPGALKRARAERAADIAKTKFGSNAISTGRGIRVQADRQSRKQSDTPKTSDQTSRQKDT
ncbi:DNA polymerase IV [Ponticaulis sp.]|uniref:DNA polymerase IV n=1 Tax=Ponticaulis sp. TaxID=2020902 RepID=UPI000C41775D|nr:DNA polymerase IV [Ponticaulis sp.]MAJ08473.1 DNA polymerase IV [Ponticaulis sp.]HBJ94627.1 DNA polymerase IV [Hyphomonadaceae bacterium]